MEIFIIALLILLNGLFSMAEIALVSARKARLESQANKGDARAAEALELSSHPEKMLSTVQIGITLISILTGIYSGDKITGQFEHFITDYFPSLIPYSKSISTTAIVMIIGFLTLIFGELVPKRIGLSKPEAIAKAVAGPMKVLSYIMFPFIWLLTRTSMLITKLLNIKNDGNQVTEEEIKAIISEGTEQGTIEETEQEIIERVFHLSDRNITSLMTHRSDIVWLDLDDTDEVIKEKILKEPHSIYPVCEGNIDHIKGIISIKDLYTHKNIPFKDLMLPASFVPDNNTAFKVMEDFKITQQHSCFIVDEYGSVLGLITLKDIMEAIVGDMPQPDEEDYEITERNDGSYLVDAQIPFYDFLSYYDKADWMNEGEQEFDTLAGFILHKLKRIPATGDTLDWNGFDFEIIDMDGHRIDKVMVKISQELKDEMEE